MNVAEIHEMTNIDPWFLDQLAELVEMENQLIEVGSLEKLSVDEIRMAKRNGYSDRQLATTAVKRRKSTFANIASAGGLSPPSNRSIPARRIRSLHPVLLLDLRTRRRNSS